MLFSSMTFIGLFLPILLAIYVFARKELKNYVLLFASILFYAWGEPKYVLIMLTTIVITFVGALGVDIAKGQFLKKFALGLAIILELSFLAYYKYFNFVIDNINAMFGANIEIVKIIMPIGISFYTFQSISYLVDVYRKDVEPQWDIFKLALYICLFPQLIAGPIVKYHDIADQIDNREESFDKVVYGIKRFIIGLSKKVLIANTLGAVADKIFTQEVIAIDPMIGWLGAISYAFQLYYDFSGYSDMAIGLGYIFGFKFMENFNYPYISKSITEFWRRWHISLSTWFKEYLYIPLGGNRVKPYRVYLNLFIVFLATGIWHGASWTFFLWGVWNGLFIILEKVTSWHKKEGKVISIIQHIYCIAVFLFGWILFRSDSVHYALDYIANMFGLISEHDILYKTMYYIDNIEVITLICAFIFATPIGLKLFNFGNSNKFALPIMNVMLIVLMILSMASIASGTYNPFIYFRF